MLAERQKKVRYSTNPNGNDWAEDTSGFGRQMLERLGWTAGTGLGKNCDGSPKPVKARGQSNLAGLGWKFDSSFGGSQQLEDYAQLLKSLNASYDRPPQLSASSTSLEELSKSSGSRLHYSKFIRAKDACKYDHKSLAIILGERPVSSDLELEANHVSRENDSASLITSSLSMNDYFKQRVAALRHVSKGRDVEDSPTVGDQNSGCKAYTPPKKKPRKVRGTKSGSEWNNYEEEPSPDTDSKALPTDMYALFSDGNTYPNGTGEDNVLSNCDDSKSLNRISNRKQPAENCSVFRTTNLSSLSGYTPY